MSDKAPRLKSTYRPSAAALAPLPPGWTEHKAPSGHTYYYNATTKESTYKRPTAIPEAHPAAAAAPPPQFPQIPNLSNPAVANAYLAQFNPPPARAPERKDQRPKPQPRDRPVSKEPIPGCEPWVLVHTKYGRRFVYHPGKGASYWRIPEKVMGGVLELDRARVAAKAGRDAERKEESVPGDTDAQKEEERPPAAEEEGDSSEYEEVEVTDDEEGDEHRDKRQRTEEPDEPALTAEEELAMQLELMQQEQEQQGDYGDDMPELSEEDARELFKDLLNDNKISPYSPWETLIEQDRLVSDPRYTALPTTKARRAVWEEWSKAKIQELKEAKAKEDKPDPRVEYMAFLERNASPKLYWPEFKRKFRKDPNMKGFELSDQERERWYREYMSRLKQPQSALKSDLTALLKSLPVATLNRATPPSALPVEIRGDTRYIALPPAVRDPLIEAYIQSLPPPPDEEEAARSEEAQRARDARRRRERALEEHNRAIEERKAEQEREKEEARRRLREGEMEVRAAGGGRLAG
ncbi:hypothetical protein VUR80DRAFT_9240 [Thermomyces stellatus]